MYKHLYAHTGAASGCRLRIADMLGKQQIATCCNTLQQYTDTATADCTTLQHRPRIADMLGKQHIARHCKTLQQYTDTATADCNTLQHRLRIADMLGKQNITTHCNTLQQYTDTATADCTTLLGSFYGAFGGAKACGPQPRKFPRMRAPQKKLVPGALQKSKLGLPYSSQLPPGFSARPYYD